MPVKDKSRGHLMIRPAHMGFPRAAIDPRERDAEPKLSLHLGLTCFGKKIGDHLSRSSALMTGAHSISYESAQRHAYDENISK